uniref:Uncharacterized protein n=1 Tax=Physcomitrium patens TaxID=3218 RepID=A0A2K1K1R3_PHYPA|nr:hypothetical protein PHYPA_012183 [Physcomitrium patens]
MEIACREHPFGCTFAHPPLSPCFAGFFPFCFLIFIASGNSFVWPNIYIGAIRTFSFFNILLS